MILAAILVLVGGVVAWFTIRNTGFGRDGAEPAAGPSGRSDTYCALDTPPLRTPASAARGG